MVYILFFSSTICEIENRRVLKSWIYQFSPYLTFDLIFFQGNGRKYFYFYFLYPEMNFLTRILYGLMYYTFRYFKNHLIFVNTQIQYGRWPPSWISRNRTGYKKIDCQNNGLWGDLNKNQPSNLGVIEMYTGLMASSWTTSAVHTIWESLFFLITKHLFKIMPLEFF